MYLARTDENSASSRSRLLTSSCFWLRLPSKLLLHIQVAIFSASISRIIKDAVSDSVIRPSTFDPEVLYYLKYCTGTLPISALIMHW